MAEPSPTTTAKTAPTPMNEDEKKTEESQAVKAPTLSSLLCDLRSNVDKTTFAVFPVDYSMGRSLRRKLVNWSVLKDSVEQLQTSSLGLGTVLEHASNDDAALDRALGCFLGMVAGDSVGAPLEFTPATSQPIEGRSPQEPYLDPATLEYHNPKNAFRLLPGQWTDDAAMGLCIAESLLVHGEYHGGDVRTRFHGWWNFGYCNAFRHDPNERSSVGLGGNISQSLQHLVHNYTNQPADRVPSRYKATGEDAGNGSIMRLAPVPIRYYTNIAKAMDMSEESSYATHPGPDAAYCCRFLAFFVCKAISRPSNDTTDIMSFTDSVIAEFLQLPEDKQHPKLKSLLQSQPPSPKEACWNWKSERLPIEETLQNRGRSYNGYPVSAEYFGSYCMDGLAMALWAITHAEKSSLQDCIVQTVNLRGDADTIGSIAGQMAGAFYGYFASGFEKSQMLRDIRQWDPICELELRAALLHQDAINDVVVKNINKEDA